MSGLGLVGRDGCVGVTNNMPIYASFSFFLFCMNLYYYLSFSPFFISCQLIIYKVSFFTQDLGQVVDPSYKSV
jgi:hypothetical protein